MLELFYSNSQSKELTGLRITLKNGTQSPLIASSGSLQNSEKLQLQAKIGRVGFFVFDPDKCDRFYINSLVFDGSQKTIKFDPRTFGTSGAVTVPEGHSLVGVYGVKQVAPRITQLGFLIYKK